MAKFYDLNIVNVANISSKDKILMAAKLGYDIVAINTIVECVTGNVSKKENASTEKKTETHIVPEPTICELSKINGERYCIRQLSRLSTNITDSMQLRTLKDARIQSYDLIAVQPTTEKLFLTACSTAEVDIIYFNLAEKLPFYLKSRPVKVALQNNIHFELQYSPGLHPSSRRFFLSNCLSIMHILKGRNVILSSGSTSVMDLRGPHDVINLGTLLGMTEEQAKKSVSDNCIGLLSHVASRKSMKSVLTVELRSGVYAKSTSSPNLHETSVTEKAEEKEEEDDDENFETSMPESKRRKVQSCDDT